MKRFASTYLEQFDLQSRCEVMDFAIFLLDRFAGIPFKCFANISNLNWINSKGEKEAKKVEQKLSPIQFTFRIPQKV